MVAECLGHLALLAPAAVLPTLQVARLLACMILPFLSVAMSCSRQSA